MRFLIYSICILSILFSSCGNKKTTAASTQNNVEQNFPTAKLYSFRVVKEYPHATDSYTQGLMWHNSGLYESTGNKGASRIMEVNLETGKPERKISLDDKYFGEGIAALDNKIYCLTWEEGKAFVYDTDTFELLDTFSYKGEGWGLTTDGEKLYMSNGTDLIYIRDPKTFAVERTINVTKEGQPVNLINELEWIDGKIWANVYIYDVIVIIDPKTGYIEGIVDFADLRDPKDISLRDDVFNGIAYKEDEGRIFVTGKNWNKLYEVEVFQK